MKINVKNIDKISEAIADVEKRCSSRKLDAESLKRAIKLAESRLSELLYKKDWSRIRLLVDAAGGQSFPSAYNGIPNSTQVGLMYSGRTWFVTSVCRDRVRSKKIEIIGLQGKQEQLMTFILNKRNDAAA